MKPRGVLPSQNEYDESARNWLIMTIELMSADLVVDDLEISSTRVP